MTAEHHIEFIYIDTDQGGFIHYFKVGDLPELCIDDCRCSIKAIYAYCNLHGLWKCDCVLKCSNAK